MHKRMLTTIFVGASVSMMLALVAPRASAQTGAPPASTIRTTGEATVTSRPDRAELDVGVVTRAATSQQAATQNARTTQNVIAALRSALGPKPTIETVSYSLQPDYQYPQQGAPTITGYTATNVVRVTLDDLASLGLAIDTAIQAGANQIERIRFTLKDESAAKAKALRGAALDARTKASYLASALGLQIVRTYSVEEASLTPRPLYDLALRSTGAATPILPGMIETTARVSLVVEFANHH